MNVLLRLILLICLVFAGQSYATTAMPYGYVANIAQSGAENINNDGLINPSGCCSKSSARDSQDRAQAGSFFALAADFVPKEGMKLSDKARDLYRQGKTREALDVHYEDLVGGKLGGKVGQEFSNNGKIWEIDVVTDSSLIQVKRSYTALNKPKNFLSKSTRSQIKNTIDLANKQGKSPEFWFKYGVHPTVRKYITDKGGVVRTGLGE